MLTPDLLHSYQKFGANHIIEKPEFGLFLDMGLGKTITTLTAIAELFENMEVSKVLIIAPKRVAESVWVQEAAKWAHTKHLTFSLISGNVKKRKKALDQEADIYLLGRDNVAWLCQQYGGTYLPFDMLVIDELSSFKNHQSIRFKALKKVRPSINRVVGLTGTPAPNGLKDLWAQIFLLDMGERLGVNIASYREAYLTNVSRSSQYQKYEARSGSHKDAVYKQIDDIVISMKAEDYLDMPEKVIIDHPVIFSEKEAKDYAEFERDKVLELISELGEGETITVAHAAALSNKLLQFANGAVYDANRNVHEVHRGKLEALDEILEAAGGKPLLVATAYQHDAARIADHLKKLKPRVLSGQKDIDDWNAGKVGMLIMHPASGGHGLNIQEGSNYIVWFGLNWSLELYKQLNARLWRQGQRERQVFIYRIVSRGTIDEKVLASLAGKEEGENELMDSVKADKAMVSAVRELVGKYKK